MSTKIYTGARITGIANRDSILAEITDRLTRLALSETIDETARGVVSIIDTRVVLEESPISAVEENQEPKVYVRVWYADDALTDTVAVYFGGPSDAFTEALTVEGLTKYGYWNNTDHPEDVTDEEWAERKSYWDRVTPDGWLKETMTDIVVDSPALDFTDPAVLDRILGQAQSRERRARNVAATLSFTGEMYHLFQVLDPSREIDGLPELMAAIEPLLVDITVETLTTAAPKTSITVDRYPELTPFADIVKVSLVSDKW